MKKRQFGALFIAALLGVSVSPPAAAISTVSLSDSPELSVTQQESLLATWADVSADEKFICTALVPSDPTMTESISGRRKALEVCEYLNSKLSNDYWAQTKETNATGFIGRVYVRTITPAPKSVAGSESDAITASMTVTLPKTDFTSSTASDEIVKAAEAKSVTLKEASEIICTAIITEEFSESDRENALAQATALCEQLPESVGKTRRAQVKVTKARSVAQRILLTGTWAPAGADSNESVDQAHADTPASESDEVDAPTTPTPPQGRPVASIPTPAIPVTPAPSPVEPEAVSEPVVVLPPVVLSGSPEIQITSAPTHAYQNDAFTVQGKVTVAGYPLPDALIIFSYWSNPTWNQMGGARTDSSGNFSFTYTFTSIALARDAYNYDIRLRYQGDTLLDAVNKNIGLLIDKRSTSIATNFPGAVKVLDTGTYEAQLTYQDGGAPLVDQLVLFEYYSNPTWISMGSARTDQHGVAQLDYAFQSVWSGSSERKTVRARFQGLNGVLGTAGQAYVSNYKVATILSASIVQGFTTGLEGRDIEVSVILTLDDGTPLVGKRVEIYYFLNPRNNYIGGITTDENGRGVFTYRFDYYRNGTSVFAKFLGETDLISDTTGYLR